MKWVYCAGKINKNDWRHRLFQDLRDETVVNTCEDETCHKYGQPHFNKDNGVVDINNKFLYAGPFFIACDHGCYHGENTHGRGAENETCYSGGAGSNPTQYDVWTQCLGWLSESDIVFAFIEDKTCYGTLTEIGWAHRDGKLVYIVFANDELAKEMWFVGHTAINTCVEKDVIKAWDWFCVMTGPGKVIKNEDVYTSEEIKRLKNLPF